jgi:hypothetical protein
MGPVDVEPQAPGRGGLSRACALVALFVALTAIMAYPLSVAPAHRAIDMGTDTRLFLWTLGWDLHALVHQPLAVFDANIFFPDRNTLAYSENLIGVALFALPWLALTGSLLTAMNMAALLSCTLSGLGAYALAREIRIGVAGALVAGVTFAFSPPRFVRIGQLHMTSIQWIPFCLMFLHRYLEGGRRRHLLATAALFTLQVMSSGHGAVFLAVAVAGLLVYRAMLGSLFPARRLLRDLGPGGLLVLALCLPFAWPYLEVKREMGFDRSLQEADSGSPDLASYLASPAHSQRFLVFRIPAAAPVRTAAAFLFPGYLPLLLAAFGLVRRPAGGKSAPREDDAPRSWIATGLEATVALSALAALAIRQTGGLTLAVGSFRSADRAWMVCAVFIVLRLVWARRVPLAVRERVGAWRRRLRAASARCGGPDVSFYLLLTVLSLWASAGPRFGLYALLYYVPGFNFIRIPSRLILVTVLGLAILAGAGWDALGRGWPSARRPWVVGSLLALLLAEFATFPIAAPPYAVEIPPIDRWLAARAGPFAIAEVPVVDPDKVAASDRRHSIYMLHSMAHWQSTVSGYSGFRPLRHAALYRALTGFPDGPSLRALKDLGVRFVVVHRELYALPDLIAFEARLKQWSPWLHLERSDGQGRVYSLRDGPTAPVSRPHPIE